MCHVGSGNRIVRCLSWQDNRERLLTARADRERALRSVPRGPQEIVRLGTLLRSVDARIGHARRALERCSEAPWASGASEDPPEGVAGDGPRLTSEEIVRLVLTQPTRY